MTTSQTLSDQNQSAYVRYRGLIILTVMLVASIEVLDSTIVNVALPTLIGGLDTNAEQVTWVLTSYIIASAIFIPLTGFLEGLVGRRRLILINILGFLLASAGCGAAVSLSTMVPARIIQGIFGAALIPLSQAVLKDSFTLQEQPKAMALWGVGVMVTPVLGPTIGGIIMEHVSWRWIFYMNVPICLASFLMALWVIPNTEKHPRSIDLKGLLLVGIGLGGLQLFLDQGPSKNWFDTPWMTLTFASSILSLLIFFIRGFRLPPYKTIINLHLLKDRNFSLSTITMGVFCASFFSILMLQPIMLQNLMGYPVLTTALIMSPRAIMSAVAMGASAQLIQRMDIRLILLIALIVFNYGTYLMTQCNLDSSLWELTYPGLYQGFGIGLIFPPLSVFALIKIHKSDVAEASGLFGYGRFLGSAIGISTLSAIINHETQVHWHTLMAKIHLMNPSFTSWWHHHPSPVNLPIAVKHAAAVIYKQASMMAFINGFWISIILSIPLIPLILLLDHKAAKQLRQPKRD